jgi:MFS-type transporter involved in bile tolerance (Atg22 family)
MRGSWIEIIIICIVVSILPLVHFPAVMYLWEIVMYSSALLLMQSLVRDITILLRSFFSKSKEPRREMQCFCLESTIGALGVIIGLVLVAFAGSRQIEISHRQAAFAITAILILGFIIKDLVITWNPFGLRREKNHLNILVTWRRKDF